MTVKLHEFYEKVPFIFAPRYFVNVVSEARDHLASERTCLSWIRLGLMLSIVATASIQNFSFDMTELTSFEKTTSYVFGYIFMVVGLASIFTGVYNYYRFQHLYSLSRPVVQYGHKSHIMAFIVSTLIGVCSIVLLVLAITEDTSG